MNFKTTFARLLVLSVFLAFSVTQFGFSQSPYAPKQPKNIIVLISDGWGINHIKATDYYQYGETGTQIYQQFPINTWMATFFQKGPYFSGYEAWDNGYNSEEAWTDFNYINEAPTGSAAAATSMASGKKTYKRSIGMSLEGEPLYNITQRAKDLGKAAGIITSVQLSHATPAAYVAHIADRGSYSDIARDMILNSKVDVIMGCGHPYYNNDNQYSQQSFRYIGGESSWADLVAGNTVFAEAAINGNNQVQDCNGDGTPDAWTLIDEVRDFKSLQTGPTPKRVFGVAQCNATLQYNRSGDYNADPFEVPYNRNVPSLEIMTKGALNVLDNNETGFFLMVEGGAVDWAGHGNNSGRMIEEQIDFNKSVEAVVNWVEQNSSWDETLVIVTGDHETGYLTGPNSGEIDGVPVWNEIENNGAGNLPGMEWHSYEHTNQLIPFYAAGAGCEIFEKYLDEEDYMRGSYLQNTELGAAQFELWPMPVMNTTPKNIMVFISDGWGKNQIAATNYFNGETQLYEDFSIDLMMSTYSSFSKQIRDPETDKGLATGGWDVWYNPADAWDSWNWIMSGATGSAPAATAMATGVKSYYKAIGVDLDQNPIYNITERAKDIGKAAGVVTSVQLSHATPAAYIAHNVFRDNYSALAQEMLLDSRADLIMGAGHPWYDADAQLKDEADYEYRYVGGEAVWNHLQNGDIEFTNVTRDNTGRPVPSNNIQVLDSDFDGQPDAWTLVESLDEFRALMYGETPKRVFGVPYVGSTLQHDRGGEYQDAMPFEVPFNQGVPTLEEMTAGALNVLDNNENGFFLMVEGGAIDWAGHGNSSPRVIEEQSDFNNAVNVAIDWVNANGGWEQNLVVVTGDHECGYLTGVSAEDYGIWNPVVDNGEGNMPTMYWNSGGHTNQLIPFYAEGNSSELFEHYADQKDEFWGYFINNSELGQAMFQAWGIHPMVVPAAWNGHHATEETATIVIPASINPTVNDRYLRHGDAIGVFYSNGNEMVCVGYTVWNGENLNITVYKDDAITPEKDGFSANEMYSFKIWDAFDGVEYNAQANYAVGPDNFQTDAVSVLGSLNSLMNETYCLQVEAGWNYIASYVKPNSTLVANIFDPVEDDLLMLKNCNGSTYAPSMNINTIGNWNNKNGYKAYFLEDVVVDFEGQRIIPESTIFNLNEGWNFIPYIRNSSMNPSVAFNNIMDHVWLIKDNNGGIYMPEYDINTLGELQPGRSYKVYMLDDIEFCYPPNAVNPRYTNLASTSMMPQMLIPEYSRTDNSASLIMTIHGAVDGEEVGVWNSNGNLVGSAVVVNEIAAINIWGDNAMTEMTDGCFDSELLTVTLERATGRINVIVNDIYEVNEGRNIDNIRYSKDGIIIANGSMLDNSNNTNSLKLTNSPNPFSSNTMIEFTVNTDTYVEIGVFSTEGERVGGLVNGSYKSGTYTVEFDGSHLGSGVYTVVMNAAGTTISTSIIKIK
jgi:alkaline phosphatase